MFAFDCTKGSASLCDQYDWYDNNMPGGCVYNSTYGTTPFKYCFASDWFELEDESNTGRGIFCFTTQSDCLAQDMSKCPEVSAIMYQRMKGVSVSGMEGGSPTVGEIYNVLASSFVDCCTSCDVGNGGSWEDDGGIYNYLYSYACVAPAGTPMWSCEQTATQKRCTYGYYSTNGKSAVGINETLNCAKCETDCGMSYPGSDSKTDCWFSAGCYATNTNGTYTFTSNCNWTN